MQFSKWIQNSVNESTYPELFQSAVDAFPNTTKRQYATQPIEISNIRYVAFKGMKTLFVKGLAQNENREYSPLILFKNVKYHKEKNAELIEVDNSFLEKIDLSANDVLLRCNCKDFFWRFNYFDHVDKSLYGRKRKKYEGQGLWEANPQKLPGMCKHLMKMMSSLTETGIIRK